MLSTLFLRRRLKPPLGKTVLPKIALGAGLLAGAAFGLAAPAQAQVKEVICSFGTDTSAVSCTPGLKAQVGDKVITLGTSSLFTGTDLVGGALQSGTFKLIYNDVPPSGGFTTPDSFQFNIDFAPNLLYTGSETPGASFVNYNIAIGNGVNNGAGSGIPGGLVLPGAAPPGYDGIDYVALGYRFGAVVLDSDVQPTPDLPGVKPEVRKQVTVAGQPLRTITLTSVGGVPQAVVDPFSDVFSLDITDSWNWNVAPGQTADSITNTYFQVNSVPGPLPILGAGVALGFSRKVRKRIKKAAVSAV